jgi:hypothetical protein
MRNQTGIAQRPVSPRVAWPAGQLVQWRKSIYLLTRHSLSLSMIYLLGCSAAYETTTGALPRSRPSWAVNGSQPEPTPPQQRGQQPPPDMRQAPGQPMAPSEATAVGDGSGY